MSSKGPSANKVRLENAYHELEQAKAENKAHSNLIRALMRNLSDMEWERDHWRKAYRELERVRYLGGESDDA